MRPTRILTTQPSMPDPSVPPVLAIVAAARMNESAYADLHDPAPPSIPGWEYEGRHECKDSGLALTRWRAQDGRLYLAVRGTHTKGDVAQSLRLFFGQNPSRRQEAFQDYIQEHCAQELSLSQLCVGGHSLGGLIAAAAAARWQLPGLVQNAPGWMSDPPSPERLSRLLEIRTSRDTIGEWGTPFPRALVVALPDLPTLEISALHSIRRQNQALERAWFCELCVEDPDLDLLSSSEDQVVPGLAGIPSRLRRAWRLLKNATASANVPAISAPAVTPARLRKRP